MKRFPSSFLRVATEPSYLENAEPAIIFQLQKIQFEN